MGKKKTSVKALSDVDQEKGFGRRSFIKGAAVVGAGVASAGAGTALGTSTARAADKVQIKITTIIRRQTIKVKFRSRKD